MSYNGHAVWLWLGLKMLLTVDEECVMQRPYSWLRSGLKRLLTVEEVYDTVVIPLDVFRVKDADDGR